MIFILAKPSFGAAMEMLFAENSTYPLNHGPGIKGGCIEISLAAAPKECEFIR